MFLYQKKMMDELKSFYEKEKHTKYSIDKLLFLFFKKISLEYSETLNLLEDKITKMEEDILQQKEYSYLNNIMLIRRSLSDYYKHIEKKHDLIEDMLLDENSLISDEGEKELSAVMRKFDRISQRTMILKDLISQVRDTYQAQEDLKLNRIMKFFTVVTTIFLPLTVITGWYGMNLKMPEFNLDYGYPIVITISLSVIIGSVLIFKKKKWF